MKKAGSLLVFLVLVSEFSFAGERQGRVAISVNLGPEAGTARLWIPYPMANGHQRIEDARGRGLAPHLVCKIRTGPGQGPGGFDSHCPSPLLPGDCKRRHVC